MFDIALRLISNFVIVFVAIVLFIAPFYWLFTRKHRHSDQHSTNFNRNLEYFFMSRYANYLVFFWAMGEAIAWFVIPEFLLLLLVFMRIQRKFELVVWDIYGTIAGTIIALAIHLPKDQIAHLPFIQPNMITQVEQWFGQHGIWGLIYQPLSGVPYKVFTHLAGNYDFFIPLFIVVAVVVRIARYYTVFAILNALYPFLHKYVYRNYVRLFVAAVFIFSILLLRIANSYGPSHHLKPLSPAQVHYRERY